MRPDPPDALPHVWARACGPTGGISVRMVATVAEEYRLRRIILRRVEITGREVGEIEGGRRNELGGSEYG